MPPARPRAPPPPPYQPIHQAPRVDPENPRAPTQHVDAQNPRPPMHYVVNQHQAQQHVHQLQQHAHQHQMQQHVHHPQQHVHQHHLQEHVHHHHHHGYDPVQQRQVHNDDGLPPDSITIVESRIMNLAQALFGNQVPGHTYSVVVTQLSDHEREGLIARLIVHTRTTPPADWILRASGFVGTSTLEAYTLLESELRLQLSRIVANMGVGDRVNIPDNTTAGQGAQE